MARPGCGVIAVRRDAVSLGAVAAGMLVTGLAFFAAAFMMSGCSAEVTVDDSSPRCESASISAGSELTDESQYVEVRLSFDAPIETAGNAADDLNVLVDEEPYDGSTMELDISADGSDLLVRLSPTSAANGSSASVYFALYGGLVSVSAKSPGGELAHVRAAGGGSNAVLDSEPSFTVPSGIVLGQVESTSADAAAGVPASVSFTVERFAQLRCCTWLSFGDDVPLVLMHNHEFMRDTEKTCAQRLADTVNANCEGRLTAEVDGARVTVSAASVIDGQKLVAVVVEGEGANPSTGKTVEMSGAASVSLAGALAARGVFGLAGEAGGAL